MMRIAWCNISFWFKFILYIILIGYISGLLAQSSYHHNVTNHQTNHQSKKVDTKPIAQQTMNLSRLYLDNKCLSWNPSQPTYIASPVLVPEVICIDSEDSKPCDVQTTNNTHQVIRLVADNKVNQTGTQLMYLIKIIMYYRIYQ